MTAFKRFGGAHIGMPFIGQGIAVPRGDPPAQVASDALQHLRLGPGGAIDLHGDGAGFDIIARVLGTMDAATADYGHVGRQLAAQAADQAQDQWFDQRSHTSAR